MNNGYLKTSTIVLLIENLWRKYKYIEQWIIKTYQDSYLYKKNKELFKMTILYFKYSFLDRITEESREDNFGIPYESMTARWLIMLYKNLKEQLTSYLKTSKAYSLARELKDEFYFYPSKILGIIMLIAILSNIGFSILLRKEIGLLGWTIRGLLFLIGWGNLFSNTNWQDLKGTSFVMKYINTYCKT